MIKKFRKSVQEGTGWILILSIAVLAVMSVLSLCIGAKKIPFTEVANAMFHYNPENKNHMILRTLRLPRTLTAAAVGGSLAVSGSLMQAVTRNPMASPSVLGINAGAGLGLALAMVLYPTASFHATVLFSFAGAGAAAGIIFFLAAVTPAGKTPAGLALAGMAITALFQGVSQSLAVFFQISQELTFWNAGGIAGVRTEQVFMLLPWTGAGMFLAVFLSGQVSLLSFGEETAVGLGGKVRWLRWGAMAAVLVLTGSSVAIVGPIGFVGLVVPHGIRFLVGADYRRVIPGSILGGALLVTAADLVARMVNPPFETPTGAVTALIGVPFFMWLASGKGGDRG